MKASEVIKLFNVAKRKARHGDVVIISDPSVKGESEIPPVLADGEVTGHAHRVSAPHRSKARVLKIANETVQRVLEVSGFCAKVDHEEHKANELPVGKYRSGVQAQWSPEGLRRVVD